MAGHCAGDGLSGHRRKFAGSQFAGVLVFLAINTVLVVCSVVYTLRKLRAAKAKGEKQDG